MRNIIIAELYKLWKNKTFLLTLIALILINIFLLWKNTSTQLNFSSHSFLEMSTTLNDMTMSEKDKFISEEFEKIQSLYRIDSVLRSEVYNNNRINVHARSQYEADFNNYFDVYKKGDYLKYTDNISSEYKFISLIHDEFQQVSNYNDFIDSIVNQASQLSDISIFSENSNQYNLRNISATAQAYADMKNITVEYSPEYGLMTALNFFVTDFIIIFLVLLSASLLIRKEIDSGMLFLIRATPNGRIKTAIAKICVLIISLLVIVTFLYGINLCFCHVNFGLGNLDRSIQSVPSLMYSTYALTVREYLLLFLLTKWLALVITGQWIMIAMLIAKSTFFGYLLSLFFLGTNVLVRVAIPATSKLNIFKYANLASLLNTNELLGYYRNLYLWGYPCQLSHVEICASFVFGLTFLLLFCCLFSKVQISQRSHRSILNTIKFNKKSTTVFRQETYKLFIIQKCALALLLFLGVQIYTFITTQNYIGVDEAYYRYYMENVEGPVTDETISWLKNESQKFEPIFQLQRALYSNKISENEYALAMENYYILQKELETFMKIQQRLEYIRVHPRAQLVYDTGYSLLFDLNQTKESTDTFLAGILCAICFSGFFAMEKQSGMDKLIFSTPRGREYTINCKLLLSTYLCFVFALLSLLSRYLIVARDYWIKCIWAPIYSFPIFSELIEIPFIFVIFLQFFSRFIAFLSMSFTTLSISLKTGNILVSLILSSLLFCLPMLLSLNGLYSAKWLSWYPLFSISLFLNSPIDAFAYLCFLFIGLMSIYIFANYVKFHQLIIAS